MSQQRKNMQDYLLIWIDAVCLVISYIAAFFFRIIISLDDFDQLFFGISVVQHESLFHEAKQI